MTSKNLGSITVSAIALILIILVAVNYCGKKTNNVYGQAYVDSLLRAKANDKLKFEDSLNFVREQAELKSKANAAHTGRIVELEKEIDSLQEKHNITKTKIKPFPSADSNYAMLVPTAYVDECETCFNKLGVYKKENIQLRFERDGYDTLMRMQADISEDRVKELEQEKLQFIESLKPTANSCDTTRKLKISAIGMANNLFLPKGGGFGLIYEDKKFNEYGGHVIFTTAGRIYLFHLAKTISFKRKR